MKLKPELKFIDVSVFDEEFYIAILNKILELINQEQAEVEFRSKSIF